jgi:Lipase (class 3)
MTVDQIVSVALPAAVAAYSKEHDSADRTVPDGFTFAGLITSGNVNWGYVARYPILTSSGAVAAKRITLVAFRGTNPKSFFEWFKDFSTLPVNISWAPNAGVVHEGFLSVYDSARPSLQALMATLPPADGETLLFVGHSLGSALALLGAYDFRDRHPQVVTFEGPRLGSATFARNWTADVPGGCQRVVNTGDIVPYVPLPPLFDHFGTEVRVDGGAHDIEGCHSLTTVLMGLQRLIASSKQNLVGA